MTTRRSFSQSTFRELEGPERGDHPHRVALADRDDEPAVAARAVVVPHGVDGRDPGTIPLKIHQVRSGARDQQDPGVDQRQYVLRPRGREDLLEPAPFHSRTVPSRTGTGGTGPGSGS
ncbi:hypothetical protein [Methanopyrus kandleri]